MTGLVLGTGVSRQTVNNADSLGGESSLQRDTGKMCSGLTTRTCCCCWAVSGLSLENYIPSNVSLDTFSKVSDSSPGSAMCPISNHNFMQTDFVYLLKWDLWRFLYTYSYIHIHTHSQTHMHIYTCSHTYTYILPLPLTHTYPRMHTQSHIYK